MSVSGDEGEDDMHARAVWDVGGGGGVGLFLFVWIFSGHWMSTCLHLLVGPCVRP